MGTDNWFHNRRRVRSQWARQSNGSKKSLKVLLVCDDSKSAVYYFEGLRDDLSLKHNVEIDKKCSGFDQKSLVDCAFSRFYQQKDILNKRYGEKQAVPYDRVYCVFDQDAPHAKNPHQQKYQDALKEVERINLALGNDIFKAITSVPCYEVWLLLHSRFTTKPFANTQQRSICHSVISDLKNGIPYYDKGDRKIYQKTKERLDIALKNAYRVEKHNQQVGTDNPSTLIHHLVKEWQELSGQIATGIV
ncbi:MAG TPA: RloB domain-containing protein [Thioploca sp.]|nr:MAG: hypothetical protein DRR19_05035 [Gammaproteobacteria bacterium]HDN27350.1 RloB domain-containing protein [Thioploca sp.]